MKLASFRKGGEIRIGAVTSGDTQLLDLRAVAEQGGAAPDFHSMLAFIDGGDATLDRARDLVAERQDDPAYLHDLSSVELLAPLPEPRQMRDAMSFETHIRQAGPGLAKAKARERGDTEELARLEAEPLAELPDIYRQIPIYYFTNRFSVRGPGSTVRWPRYSEIMDYELELACITKGRGANIRADQAGSHIFGYTIFNDFSARDRQMLEMQGRLGPSKGKSFDGGNVIGPWIVTADEMGSPSDLRMEARVNGEIRCSARSQGMLFSFEELIAYISQDETLMPGEVIGSGTVGNGCGAETGIFLQHGDIVELEIEKIGVLRNRVERQEP